MSLRQLLVDDWHSAWQWSSVRLHAAVLALNVLCQAMPYMDPSIAAMFPKPLQSPLIGGYATLALILRLTRWRERA